MNTERSSSVGKFSLEKLPHKIPLHFLHQRKISQLESKVQFFEGQVDPLYSENDTLKEQLIILTKMVSSSADLLRNLLPNQHPSRKLKLQLASITQISQMIKEDWLGMEAKLASNDKTIRQLTKDRDDWHCRYQQENKLRQTQLRQLEGEKERLRTGLEENIEALMLEMSEQQSGHQKEKEGMKADFQRKMKLFEFSVKQYELFKVETKKKDEQYQQAIERLKGEIQANQISYEENKKNLKEIYDKLMSDKLAEQAEGYDLVIKAKEQEKISLLMQIGELEEEQKRKLTQKDFEITQLNDLTSSFKVEIGGLKDNLWKHQLAIDKHIANEQALHGEIEAMKGKTKGLEEKIEAQREQSLKEKIQFQLKLRRQEKEMELIKKEGSKAMTQLLDAKKKIELQLEETAANYKKSVSMLAKTEAKFNSSISKMKEEWAKEEAAFKQTIAQTQLKLQEQIKSLRFSQLLNEDLIKQNAQKIEGINKFYRNKEEELVFKYEKQLESQALESEQLMDDLKKKHEYEMKEAAIAANEEMRQMIVDCNKKLTAQASTFEQLLEQAKKEEERVGQLLKSAQKQISLQQQEKEALRKEHLLELKQLQERKEQEKLQLSQEMQKQMKEFQRSLEEKEAELSHIMTNMENEIKMLKQANAVESVEHFYQNQISKLKHQFTTHYQQLEEQRRKQVQELVVSHQKTVEKMNDHFNQDLDRIAKKTQEDEDRFNRTVQEEGEGGFEKMTPEDKKQYIAKKINTMKTQIADKDAKIVAMQIELKEMENHIEARVKARRQELEKEKVLAIKRCDEKVAKTTQECAARVAAVEQQRLEHSLLLKDQFQKMKESHARAISTLEQRYSQLQTLFEERPSRAQDLSKIKQLINLQSKMDIEIQSYQKKMETANEIVRYLNLQLENYKDAYDMFGPEGKEIGIVGQSAIKLAQPSQSPSISESQQLKELIRVRKHQRRESEPKREETQSESKESLSFRKWNDTPSIKELKIFEDNGNDNDELIFDPHLKVESPSSKKIRRYSNLMIEKAERRGRFKTENSVNTQKPDNESEIMANAQNFIRLIKGGELSNPVIREEQQLIRRKGYRKRKLNKKNPTVGLSQYL